MNPTQYESLELMINSLKNKNSTLNGLDNSRIYMDEKIKNNPLESYNTVSDGRSLMLVESGIGSWAAKQTGINSGKLNLN